MDEQLFIIPDEVMDSLDPDTIGDTAVAMREVGVYALPFPKVVIRIGHAAYGRYLDRAVDSYTIDKDHMEDSKRFRLMMETTCTSEGDIHTRTYSEKMVAEFSAKLREMKSNRDIFARRPNLPTAPRTDLLSRMDTNIKELETTLSKMNETCKRQETDDDGAASPVEILVALLATPNCIKEKKIEVLGAGKSKGTGVRKATGFRYTTTLRIGHYERGDSKECSGHGSVRPHLRRGHVRQQHYGPKNGLVKSVFIAPVFVGADKEYIDNRRKAYKFSTKEVA